MVYLIGADSPTLDRKIAWVRYIPGAVSITARRVDGTSAEIRTATIQGYGETGFNPSGIDLTTEGCWRVTGTLAGRELTFVMFVRRGKT